jgi:hypothetical protein
MPNNAYSNAYNIAYSIAYKACPITPITMPTRTTCMHDNAFTHADDTLEAVRPFPSKHPHAQHNRGM